MVSAWTLEGGSHAARRGDAVDAEDDHDERLEREAWTFAAHLLIPDQGLHRLRRLRVDEVAKRWGVGVVMAGNRIKEFEKNR